MKRKLTRRLIRYAKVWTTSNENSTTIPSSSRQMKLAQLLKDELIKIGMQDVTLDDKGYLYASLPSNDNRGSKRPVIGFIAHMDTAPDAPGKNVNPRVVEKYDGKDIVLNEELGITMSPEMFPELKRHINEDLIVTDGTTLLGADDKAGIAEIITAMEWFIQNPKVRHREVRIAFNPDEEIGRGAHNFNVDLFGCDFAYTIDGGEVGELEYENFNAASATVTITGRSVHPGTAKGKMINAQTLGMDFNERIPFGEAPENTEGYEGFFHLTDSHGNVEKCVMHYIIRDHDMTRFEMRKQRLQAIISQMNEKYNGAFQIEIKDQYYNMIQKVDEANKEFRRHRWPDIIDLAKKAMTEAGVTPVVQPIRGGTDGAQLSFKGLPCPNIFAGGMNMHGRFEYVPVESMVAATQTIINICKK